MAGVLASFFGTGEDIKSRSNSDNMTVTQQDSKYVASIDQGTSSSRCIVFGQDGSIVSEHQMEHEQFYPRPGRVEHDADEIWVCAAVTGRSFVSVLLCPLLRRYFNIVPMCRVQQLTLVVKFLTARD